LHSYFLASSPGMVTTEVYTLSLHVALPIYLKSVRPQGTLSQYVSSDTQALGLVLEGATGIPLQDYMKDRLWSKLGAETDAFWIRSEEHTSELQSRENLVCRLLLEKKKNAHL